MSTPESGQGQKPPAKRPESDQVPNTEQPEAKRPKLGDPQPELGDDTGMGSQSSSKQSNSLGEGKIDWDLRYCLICSKMVDHKTADCPNKSKGYGMFCFVCEGPCKSSNDEHKGEQIECIKFCEICGSKAKHWSDDCPYEDSKYFGTGTRQVRNDDGFF